MLLTVVFLDGFLLTASNCRLIFFSCVLTEWLVGHWWSSSCAVSRFSNKIVLKFAFFLGFKWRESFVRVNNCETELNSEKTIAVFKWLWWKNNKIETLGRMVTVIIQVKHLGFLIIILEFCSICTYVCVTLEVLQLKWFKKSLGCLFVVIGATA